MSRTAIVVHQLVPYHDARFSAAARLSDFTALQVFGQDKGLSWSDAVARQFDYKVLAHRDADIPWPDRARLLWSELDRLAPEFVAIQGWSDRAALTTAQWALQNDAGIVLFSESNSYDHPRRPVSEATKTRILNLCDAAFVGGRDHVDYLKQLGFDEARITLGYNAIDNRHFAPSGTDARTPDRPPFFLLVCRLAPEKNIQSALRAYARYRQMAESPRWDLLILGIGPLEEQLKSMAGELGVAETARFEGFRKYEDLPALYHAAGALLHVSTGEPWGLVVNEAMAAGLPVIVSTSCGCCCELVRNGENGFAVDPMQIDAIAEHMRDLSDGRVDRRRMGEASSKIIANWGPERFATGFRAALDIAAERRAPRGMLDRLTLAALARWK